MSLKKLKTNGCFLIASSATLLLFAVNFSASGIVKGDLIECSTSKEFNQALLLLDSSRKAVLELKFEIALEMENRALNLLGDSYQDPRVMDDTSMNIVFADSAERRGEYKNAANLKLRVLESRLESLKTKCQKHKSE